MVPDAAWPGSDQRPWGTAPAACPPGQLGRSSAPDPCDVVCCCLSLSRPRHARPCGVLGHLAPVHRCARSVCCLARAVSWATCILFTGVHFWCAVQRPRCPGPPGSCSTVCLLGLLSRAFGVLGHLAPVHRCTRSVRSLACAVSWAAWVLFTGLFAHCVVSRVRCPGPLGSRSPVCPRSALSCACGVLGHLGPAHRCARSERCLACAVSQATWLLFTGLFAWCLVARVRCPGRPGSCSPMCPLGPLTCVCGVLGHLSLVHRCARSVRSVARAVSLAARLLFTGVLAGRVVLRAGVVAHLARVHRCARSVLCVACARCPGPLGSCSTVCSLCALSCVCGILGPLASVHRCARLVCCVVVRCPLPLGSSSVVCPLGALCCVCGVLGHLAPVHRYAHLVRCVACAVSWATWLLSDAVLVWCAGLRVCGILGNVAPVQRCAPLACCVACAVSWAIWLLSDAVLVWCVALRVCAILGNLAPVHRCARSVCCVTCAVSWAT